MKRPSHIKWLSNTGIELKTEDGKKIEVWAFNHKNDSKVLSEWSTHFRNHYCSDNQIDILVSGTGKTKSEFLIDIKFPDAENPPGPSVRSGDFAEILVADYLEYICSFWVPRLKYADKMVRNESLKGADILGFKLINTDIFSFNDEMIIFETKAAFTDTNINKLQEAIDHSAKDEIRKAETLNALKQKFFNKNEIKNVEKIQRFQNLFDNPYLEKYGAAAVLDSKIFEKIPFSETNTSQHIKDDKLYLLIIKGEQMMLLVHELYKRAADEA